ncbi:MAG: SEL1-like repeat protein, partial [Verrucomicrobiia bacterium]
RGDAEAQFQLGLLHLKGLDAPPQFVQAYKWFTLAMEADHALAEGERDALSGIMKNSQIIEAKKLARKFKPVKD